MGTTPHRLAKEASLPHLRGMSYGGDGNDLLPGDDDGQRDKLYCGEGRDEYVGHKNDYVVSRCEKRRKWIDFGE